MFSKRFDFSDSIGSNYEVGNAVFIEFCRTLLSEEKLIWIKSAGKMTS